MFFRVLLIALWVGFGTSAQAASTARVALPERGSVFFLGDSITWQNQYTALVETVVRRRMPERPLRWVNLGVRADTADDVRRRLPRDLAPHKPALVFVMLGINDGAMLPPSGRLLDGFERSMRRLLDAIAESTSARVVLLTPTCVAASHPTLSAYNPTLAAMSKRLQALGEQRELPVIDVHAAFCAAQKRASGMQPPVELLHPDGIHPTEAGHLVIADAILSGIELPKRESTAIGFRGDPCDGKPRTIRVRHDHRNVHLPSMARTALPLTSWQQRSGGYMLRGETRCATKLLLGTSTLIRLEAGQLARGLELDAVGTAPWQRESRYVWELVQTRWRWFYAGWDPRGLGAAALIDVGGPRLPSVEIKPRVPHELQRIEAALVGLHDQGPKDYVLYLQADEGR